ncbi:GAF and ANTAR domain-containing protein [Kineococcus sp. NBC_00420]|uniref:GAF and ANTAR domain-containing protein n=1 Tax=Kineococcus sp. NBC_00420 TaxID=2903564 RepID=UPI002E1B8DD5
MRRESDVIQALVKLADSLVVDYDPLDLLQRVVDNCMRVLDVTAVGLLLAGQSSGQLSGQGRQLQVVAASSEQMRVLEVIQLHINRGPCLEAYARGERVVAEDLEELRRRWADFATDVAAAGFRAVAAVPLRLREHKIGALGLFSDREHAPTDVDIDVAQAFADIATIALLQQQAIDNAEAVSAHLQHALESRVIIEQAKGIIATQQRIPVSDAFTVIRDHARSRNVKLSEVTRAIVAGELTARDLRAGPVRSSSSRPR